MGWFRHDLLDEVEAMIRALEKKETFLLRRNWVWWDYRKKERKIGPLEDIDDKIISKIRELHLKGRDIPALSAKLLLLCNELKRELDGVINQKGLKNHPGEEAKRISRITSEIEGIFSQEKSRLHNESHKLIEDNAVIRKFKDSIVAIVKRQSLDFAEWQNVEKQLREMLTTHAKWMEFTRGADMLELRDVKYKKYYASYKKALGDINAALEAENKKAGKNIFDITRTGWFHIVTTPELKKAKVFGTFGVSLKRYISIPLSDCFTVLKYLIKLAKALRDIGIRTNDSIEVKVAPDFLTFAKHSDSIVIHYKNSGNTAEINKIALGWMSQYGIHEEKRQYNRITDIRDSKISGSSFSDHVAHTVAAVMKVHYSKVSAEVLAVYGINSAIRMSQVGF